MRLLRLAIENQRWDLAAHTIILATAKVLNDEPRSSNQRGGDKPHASKSRQKKRRSKGQSER